MANPLKPTARTKKVMAIPLECEYPTTSRRVASIPKPETPPVKQIDSHWSLLNLFSSFLCTEMLHISEEASTFELIHFFGLVVLKCVDLS